MRLTKIKLAGFKSFVDPTVIHITGRLTGVVGPNGCGKSNVIDAVRWVMGESSAKHLRGDSMEDVIFSGSSARKPVGQASVELVFDNTDGAVGGQYAAYNEIAVKRSVSRDGQSKYSLNGTRCRRRDIADIFLGTGLGPRSYAIIEQGMVSRLIEAKPDEIRLYIEEAAGISKYKERRRETENRIRHTRDNLDRLNDLREELDKQLERLQRQARTAERYQQLKADEQRYRAELLALRWRALDEESQTKDIELRLAETRREELVASLRAVENELETLRQRHADEMAATNVAQGEFYQVGSEISRTEQSIRHAREMLERTRADLEQLDRAREETQANLAVDRQRLSELDAQLDEHLPRLEQAERDQQASREALQQAETAMADWQRRSDGLVRREAESSQASQVESARLDHLRETTLRLNDRLARLDAEHRELGDGDGERERAELADREQRLDAAMQADEAALVELAGEIAGRKQTLRAGNDELDQLRRELQGRRGRLASLEALQEAALGGHQRGVVQWLERQGLAEQPRLAQQIRAEAGWEHAVETVLGAYLEAICVDGTDAVTEVLDGLEHGSVVLLDSGHSAERPAPARTLAARVDCALDPNGVLARVFTADDLSAALARRATLGEGQSVITRDGLWLGPGWLRVSRPAESDPGVLLREQQIRELAAALETAEVREHELLAQRDRSEAELADLERRRDEGQEGLRGRQREHAELGAQRRAAESRRDELAARRTRLEAERGELLDQQTGADREITAATLRLQGAQERMEQLTEEGDGLAAEKTRLQGVLDEHRSRAFADREDAHALALRQESLRTARATTAESMTRMQQQLEQLERRHEELQASAAQGRAPLDRLQEDLEGLVQRRVTVEQTLNETRATLQSTEDEMRRADQRRMGAEADVEAARAALEALRLAAQELRVRGDTLREQFAELSVSLEEVLPTLTEEHDIESWEQQLESVARRIQRLGPINLAAIEEYDEQSERKTYLDAQHLDLSEALETLEGAIRKIDRETRNRFKDTFDRVNAQLQAVFPRLFGGGNAHLELTSDDLLDTGVTIMARPPGKRISTIHLLSGGEKAMTAVAMIFAIFELNPAPFCLLDEVDAPLDDANVGRFCDLVREMSEYVQFVFITHNKITMELASQLTGVTMREAGVSRMVSVDVDEAVQLAAV